MKTGGGSRSAKAATRRAGLVDFLFVGAGVAPLALMLGGQPEIAFLVLIPVLFAACLCGAWEQARSGPGHPAGDGEYGGQLDGKRPATVTTLRDRLKR